MEYSKEDLMEAKKQIWGVGENMGTEESKKIWEENAQFWDNAMGDESNEFHREVVRPKVTELLSPNPADYILDIACGNGNYSSYLAQRGASVVAFDYSKKMIELAKRRQSQYAKQIEFCVADATDRKSILEEPLPKQFLIWQLWILRILNHFLWLFMNCWRKAEFLSLQRNTLVLSR